MLLSSLLAVLATSASPQGPTTFQAALDTAEKALAANDQRGARQWIDRALERDAKSMAAWELKAKWAEASGERDEQVYALHRARRLAVAQNQKVKQQELRARLETLDPIAPDLLDLSQRFVKSLVPLAQQYEKEHRPHSAIRVHQQILTLDPDLEASRAAIQRISAAPDPSLAETAKPKNLLADVSEEWIARFDAEHATWDTRAKLERDNYTTHTNAGYAVLVQAGEAMEQMNAFYRRFFRYGTAEDGKTVPRIDLHIFKTREDYLKLGIGPPVEWSGGHFTGGAVETYIGTGGFEGMVSTLFHEAAHQFVSLATTASGWLNEGLASFFEGTRILANGTVIMNMPANHRLFPLVERMERGWMTSADDGIDPANAAKTDPPKAPTFRIVIENEYSWGPPWYAPTWGVVYFLYNYQDPADGRFVYRRALGEFLDSSGGRVGSGAVRNFEEVVLANPEPVTKGLPKAKAIALPATIAELDAVWKQWMIELRDEQNGSKTVERPYLAWARHAIARKDWDVALEHFEKGVLASPDDPLLLTEAASFFATHGKNPDRATKLVLQALRVLESKEPRDAKAVEQAEALLAKWDPKRTTLERLHSELTAAAGSIAQRYLAADLPLMAMDVSWRLSNDLDAPGLLTIYETAARRSHKTLAQWHLAYNEHNLDGWANVGNTVFTPDGEVLRAKFGAYAPDTFEYRFLALDTITSGDYSLEAEVMAERERVNFCGLVFGKKSDAAFHALILHPGHDADAAKQRAERPGSVDLTTFFGLGTYKIWRHNPVDTTPDDGPTRTAKWHTLKLDIAGNVADVWFDGELIVSQQFASLDVLRGSFGLITGAGDVAFRNVRYLARAARDPSAQIERAIRMEALAAAGKGNAAGSYLDQEPPFPTVAAWLQDPRRSWDERGRVPTLLVLWSPSQNDAIPIDRWLAHLHAQYAPTQLQIVAIAAPDETTKTAEYLAAHPLPGSVGVDARDKPGLGTTFERYELGRFRLPRLLLLDVNHRVVWEGDPGFRAKTPWTAEAESYLDGPLEELVTKRKLRELIPWRAAWNAAGRAALHDGNVAAAWPGLAAATALADCADESVAEATQARALLEASCATVDSVGSSLQRRGLEAALEALPAWATVAGKPLDARAQTTLKRYLDTPAAKAWSQAKAMIKQLAPQLHRPGATAAAQATLVKLQALDSPMVKELARAWAEAIASSQQDALVAACGLVETIPARVLAREYFGW